MLAGVSAAHLAHEGVRYLIDPGLVRPDAIVGLMVAKPSLSRGVNRGSTAERTTATPAISPAGRVISVIRA